MADIFLSYAKEDRERARHVSLLLEKEGWSVWWDRRIPAGRTWRDVLEDALRNMRCMVVLWSSRSVDSDWVKEEAEEARAVKKLVPVLIEPVNPPVGFRTIQAADLTDWDGSSETVGARQLIADLEALIGKPRAAGERTGEPEAPAAEASSASQRSRIRSEITAAAEPSAKEASRSAVAAKIHVVPWKVIAGVGVLIALMLAVVNPWSDPKPAKDQDSQPQESAANESIPAGDARGAASSPVGNATAPAAQKPAMANPPAVARATAPAESPTPPPAAAPKIEPKPTLVKLAIVGAPRELEPDESLRLTLRGQFSDGSEDIITRGVDWSSSTPRVASVDPLGKVTARRAGTARIVARHEGMESASWLVKVTAPEVKPPPPKLEAMTIDAGKKNLAPQEKVTLRVTGRYSDGTVKTISGKVAWASSDSAVASVTPGGELEAKRAGEARVVARLDDISSRPLVVSVTEPPAEAPAPKKPVIRPASPQPSMEQLRAKIASYIERAKDFRVQGDYQSALAELALARAVDPTSAEVKTEVEQTKRACLAEKKLGRKGLEC